MLICPDCHGIYAPCATCNGIGGVLGPKLGGPVRNGQSRLSGWTTERTMSGKQVDALQRIAYRDHGELRIDRKQ